VVVHRASGGSGGASLTTLPRVHRLSQERVDRGDFDAAAHASARGQHVDASELILTGDRLRELLDCLPRSPAGDVLVQGWSFVGAHFRGAASFAGCELSATCFDDARFDAGASFRSVRFSRARFDRASFGTGADFSGASLGTKAHFRSACFDDGARFARASFQATQFHDCGFGAQASFRQADFSDLARFSRSRFADRPNFTDARFERGADFAGASFGEQAQMVRVHFGGSASFAGAEFGDRARLTHWEVDGRLTMRSTRFGGRMSLHGAHVSGDAIFRFARFSGTSDIGAVRVDGHCSFTEATFTEADRIGPLYVGGVLLFAHASFRRECSIEVDARVLAMPAAHILAPSRIVVRRAAVVLNGLQASARLVLSAAPGGAAEDAPRLLGAEGADVGTLVVSGLDVRALRLRGADNIDKLRLETEARFEPVPKGARVAREAVAEEHLLRCSNGEAGAWYPSACRPRIRYPERPTDRAELARIYRGLRKAREDAKDWPGAGDLYYAEMEMRRSTAWAGLGSAPGLSGRLSRLAECFVLGVYKHGAGYGVRPSRPFLTLLAAVLAATVVADLGGALTYVPNGTTAAEPAGFDHVLVFVLRSALLLPTPSSFVLGFGGDVIQIVFRLLGPLLIGLLVLGLRARVQR